MTVGELKNELNKIGNDDKTLYFRNNYGKIEELEVTFEEKDVIIYGDGTTAKRIVMQGQY